MDWVWILFEQYIRKIAAREHGQDPSDDILESVFFSTLRDSSVTILVQEPWRGSVRFKTLQKSDSSEVPALLNEPMEYLLKKYGGGKFKLNFHHGYNFVATRNFKPEGEPLWPHIPELTI